jgi:hypothetical protein
VETKLPGIELRTREAIEQSGVVVVGTLVDPGVVSPGPPGEQDIDDATFRIERTLSPAGAGAPHASGTVKLSYSRRVFPESAAEAAMERGQSYVLFCTKPAQKRLYALKAVPHSEDAVRVVVAAFSAGVKHAAIA